MTLPDIHEVFNPQTQKEYGEIYADEGTKSHIYALFDSKNNLLYIGQAQSVHNRFKAHCKNFSQVSFCKYFRVSEDQTNDIEFELICKFSPPLNKNLPKTNKYMTLEQYQSKDTRFYTNRVRVHILLDELKISNLKGFYKVEDLDQVSLCLSGVSYE